MEECGDASVYRYRDGVLQAVSMWIRSVSGLLINSDAVREFAVVGPYSLAPNDPDEEARWYDLLAIGVGVVELSFHGRPFIDADRYLVQHTCYDTANYVLDKLTDALRRGDRFFDAYVHECRWRDLRKQKMARKAAMNAVSANTALLVEPWPHLRT